MMCASVREQMMLGVNDYLAIDRTQWMQNWPGQIVLNGSQVNRHLLLQYPPSISVERLVILQLARAMANLSKL